MSYDHERPEGQYNHEHSYPDRWHGACDDCAILDSNVLKRQNAILCAATNIGLPKNFARDLLIDCMCIAKNPAETATFGLLLRENGSQLCWDAETAYSCRYWIDNDELQQFYIYKSEHLSCCTENGQLERVYKHAFKKFLDELEGVGTSGSNTKRR